MAPDLHTKLKKFIAVKVRMQQEDRKLSLL